MADQSTPGPINAALVIDQLTFDRLGPVIEYLAVGLLDYISGVTLITPAKAALRVLLGPVSVIRYDRLHWPTRQRTVRRILEELNHNPPTLIHALTSRSFELGEELAGETDRPLVAHLLGSEDLRPRFKSTFAGAKKVIAASEPLLQAANQRKFVDPGRLTLIRPGLLPASSPACFALEGRLPAILCMSALEPTTGVDRLIRAVKILVQEQQDLMLFLVARGPSEKRLRKLVEAEDLIKHVTFGQPVFDWLKTMRAADIFVVPGNVDRVDVRLLHALAAGVAAVCGKMPNSDFVVDGRTAVVCPDLTPESMAAGLRRLLQDRAQARRLAAQAQQHCREHHSLSQMAEKTAKVYAETIAAPAD